MAQNITISTHIAVHPPERQIR